MATGATESDTSNQTIHDVIMDLKTKFEQASGQVLNILHEREERITSIKMAIDYFIEEITKMMTIIQDVHEKALTADPNRSSVTNDPDLINAFNQLLQALELSKELIGKEAQLNEDEKVLSQDLNSLITNVVDATKKFQDELLQNNIIVSVRIKDVPMDEADTK